MPTYDYQCRLCGHTVEVIHPMAEDGPTACEVCSGPLRRIIFPAGIIFKGSGFYKTDSRSHSSSSTASNRNGGSTPSADGGSADSTGAKSDDGSKGATASGEPAPAKPKTEKRTSDAASTSD
jgi:putative FmdB family regulatory protein